MTSKNSCAMSNSFAKEMQIHFTGQNVFSTIHLQLVQYINTLNLKILPIGFVIKTN